MRKFAPLPLESLLPWLAGADRWLLLDTALPGPAERFSYLFMDPVELLSTCDYRDVRLLLGEVERAAGVLSYEAGYGIEPALGEPAGGGAPAAPVAWFGLYRKPFVFDHAAGGWLGKPPAAGGAARGDESWAVEGLELDAGLERFAGDVAQIKKLIAAGQTYQVNYTRRFRFRFRGDVLAFYRALRKAQPVPYAALLRDGGWCVLSLSPELFFRLDPTGRIITRPMKGTIGRGRDISEDRRQARQLRLDPKNRAENLMIVDLLRNDLGRLCRTGSVAVTSLFAVERYETLLQMTSTVEGVVAPGTGIAGVFEALFPSGSVTGAPKISTMKIISRLEDSPRGIYTGSLGFIAPAGRACFSVPIRTVELKGELGVMGAGCGIVADSRAEDEYEECRLKGRFLTDIASLAFRPEFELVETMLCEGGRVALLELHLDRMRESARFFGRPFDRRTARKAVAALISSSPHRLKVRLLLNASGRFRAEAATHKLPQAPLKVAVFPESVDTNHPFCRHKTTGRPVYQMAREQAQAKGIFDYIFLDRRGQVIEGAITNVYAQRAGILYTPPLRAGCLPGVYRRYLKTRGEPLIRDRLFGLEEFKRADRLWVSNAVIGLLEAELVDLG